MRKYDYIPTPFIWGSLHWTIESTLKGPSHVNDLPRYKTGLYIVGLIPILAASLSWWYLLPAPPKTYRLTDCPMGQHCSLPNLSSRGTLWLWHSWKSWIVHKVTIIFKKEIAWAVRHDFGCRLKFYIHALVDFFNLAGISE